VKVRVGSVLDRRAELQSRAFHEHAERQRWPIAVVHQDVDSGAKVSCPPGTQEHLLPGHFPFSPRARPPTMFRAFESLPLITFFHLLMT
jgi:hypothetical protein